MILVDTIRQTDIATYRAAIADKNYTYISSPCTLNMKLLILLKCSFSYFSLQIVIEFVMITSRWKLDHNISMNVQIVEDGLLTTSIGEYDGAFAILHGLYWRADFVKSFVRTLIGPLIQLPSQIKPTSCHNYTFYKIWISL